MWHTSGRRASGSGDAGFQPQLRQVASRSARSAPHFGQGNWDIAFYTGKRRRDHSVHVFSGFRASNSVVQRSVMPMDLR